MEEGLNSKTQTQASKFPPKPKLICPHCSKLLSSAQNLKDHLYIHTGEKPYSCTEPGCDKKFRQGSLLSIHRRIHSEVKEGICGSGLKPKRSVLLKLTDLVSRNSEVHKTLDLKMISLIKSRMSDEEFEFVKEFLVSY